MTEAEKERAAIVEWRQAHPVGLEAAVAAFKKALPGWWFTVGECQVSADASCGPTKEAPEHLALIPQDPRFDDGFHVDVTQPATMAEALGFIQAEALKTIEKHLK